MTQFDDVRQYLEASFSTDSTKRAFKNIIALVSRRVGKKFMGGMIPLKFKRQGGNFYGYTYYTDNKAVRFNMAANGGSTEILSVDVWTSPNIKPQLMADIKGQGLNLVQTVNLVTQMLKGKRGDIDVAGEGNSEPIPEKSEKEKTDDAFMNKRSKAEAERNAVTAEEIEGGFRYKYVNLGESIDMQNAIGSKKTVNRIKIKVRTDEAEAGRYVKGVGYVPRGKTPEEVKANKVVRVRNALPEVSELELKFRDNPLFQRAGTESFAQIEAYIKSVISWRRTGLLITGDPGVGKTFTVQKELDKAGAQYEEFKGNIKSATNLYSLLWNNNDPDKILVFDDCDSVLQDEAQTEILKGALDDKKIRLISYIAMNLMTPVEYVKYLIGENKKKEAIEYVNDVKLANDPKIKQALLKRPTFEDVISGGMEELENYMEAKVADDSADEEDGADEEKDNEPDIKIRGTGAKLPIPNKFAYKGRMVVISNLYQSSIPGALRTRLNPVELDLTPKEIMGRIKEVNLSIGGATKQDIQKVWDFINDEVSEYLNKMDFRSFSNAVKVYLDLDGKGPWKKWVGTSLVNTFGKFGGAMEKKKKR